MGSGGDKARKPPTNIYTDNCLSTPPLRTNGQVAGSIQTGTRKDASPPARKARNKAKKAKPYDFKIQVATFHELVHHL